MITVKNRKELMRVIRIITNGRLCDKALTDLVNSLEFNQEDNVIQFITVSNDGIEQDRDIAFPIHSGFRGSEMIPGFEFFSNGACLELIGTDILIER